MAIGKKISSSQSISECISFRISAEHSDVGDSNFDFLARTSLALVVLVYLLEFCSNDFGVFLVQEDSSRYQKEIRVRKTVSLIKSKDEFQFRYLSALDMGLSSFDAVRWFMDFIQHSLNEILTKFLVETFYHTCQRSRTLCLKMALRRSLEIKLVA